MSNRHDLVGPATTADILNVRMLGEHLLPPCVWQLAAVVVVMPEDLAIADVALC